jgi:four helix bundle protein
VWLDTWKITPVDAFVVMPTERTFRDLVVWRKAHEFVLTVYAFTAGFPKQETYGLTLQMRRAAISIPANIAEGFRRRGKADKARFMNLAEGSVEESVRPAKAGMISGVKSHLGKSQSPVA